MAAAIIRLLVLENVFLVPSHDIYLLVGTYIKYRVAKMVQGRVTGKVTYHFLRLTFPKSFLLRSNSTSCMHLFSAFIIKFSLMAILELILDRDSPRILNRLNAIVWLLSFSNHRHMSSPLKQPPKTYQLLQGKGRNFTRRDMNYLGKSFLKNSVR